MTRKELQHVEKVLVRIKDPDAYIQKAIALVRKDLAHYDACRGQLKEQYEVSDFGGW